jgi:hypothetical protein
MRQFLRFRHPMTAAVRATAVLFIAAVVVAACARSVSIRQPQSGSLQSNPVAAELALHDRADEATFRVQIDSQDITSLFAFAGSPRHATATLPNLGPGGHTLDARADFRSTRVGDVHGDAVQFQTTGPPAPPPSPEIALTLSPTEIAAPWGSTMSANATIQGRNGFAGNVALTSGNPPFGVSPQFTPATVAVPANGTVTSTLGLATTEAATALGVQQLQVGAVPVGGGAASVTRLLAVRVQRTPGNFDPVTLLTATSNCGNISALVVPAGTASGVLFREGSTVLNSSVLPFSTGYAISHSCRSAVVVPPPTIPPLPAQSQFTTNLISLGFSANIGVGIPGRGAVAETGAGAFTNGYFSPDGSLFVLVTPSGLAPGFPVAAANLIDVARGVTVQPPKLFNTSVTGVVIRGDRVTLNTNPPLSDPDWLLP